jgi:hypothetical protein
VVMGRRPRAREPSARPANPTTTAAVGAAVLWSVSQVRGTPLRRTLRTAGPMRSCGRFEAGAQAQEQMFLPHASRRHLP